MTAALELSGIHKRFGPVHALRGADFTLAPGEVHALLGENGAGKSTLMHIAAGVLQADAGTLTVRGTPATLHSPREARRAGIGLVHQHFTAIPALTVAENVALTAGWAVTRPAELRARVRSLTARTGLALDPDARTEDLPVGARQRLEILKTLAADTTILLLDEPTAVLAPSEADEVVRRIRTFVAAGGSAVLITHKLDEALAAADRVTVLRGGRVVLAGAAGARTPAAIAAAMVGEAEPGLAPPAPPSAASAGAPLVACRGISLVRRDGRGLAIREGHLAVAGGEIVGVAAVEGSGQHELLRAIAGLVAPSGGALECAVPVAFIPEDRSTEGLIGEFSVVENVALGFGADAPWVRRGWLDWRAVRQRSEELVARYGIRTAGVDAPAASLSGGNQQKVVVARALERRPRVVVAENPTRGLDVHAARDIWSAFRRAAADGAAVVVWSSDLDEVMRESTRLIVVARGAVHPPPAGADRTTIGAMMVGGPIGARR